MRMIRYRIAVLSCLLLSLTACALPPPPAGKPLPPGYLYEAKFLNIRSPNQEGWYLAGASQSGMQFNRHGDKKEGTFTALVTTFPLPEIHNADEFLAFIKQAFHSDIDRNRFKIVKLNIHLSHARKYLCVNVGAVIEESQVTNSDAQHEGLLTQSISLYCRHPVNDSAGFAITYSHRGKSLYPGLSKQAQDFIDGVQVPS